MKNIIVIPARAGSKGIQKKNIVQLANKPLVEWTMDFCKNLDIDYEVLICTDMNEVKEIAKKYNFNSDYPRPEFVSEDKTSMYETVIDLVGWYEKKYNNKVENIILLQPTNPFRSLENLYSVVNLLKNKVESCFTVVPTFESPYEMIKFENHGWSFLKNDNYACRRQDYESEYYFIDGSIYGCKKDFLKKHGKFIVKNISIPIKCKRELSWDIDSIHDLRIAECMISSFKNRKIK